MACALLAVRNGRRYAPLLALQACHRTSTGGVGQTGRGSPCPANFRSFAKLVAFPLAQTGEGISECELVSWSVKVRRLCACGKFGHSLRKSAHADISAPCQRPAIRTHTLMRPRSQHSHHGNLEQHKRVHRRPTSPESQRLSCADRRAQHPRGFRNWRLRLLHLHSRRAPTRAPTQTSQTIHRHKTSRPPSQQPNPPQCIGLLQRFRSPLSFGTLHLIPYPAPTPAPQNTNARLNSLFPSPLLPLTLPTPPHPTPVHISTPRPGGGRSGRLRQTVRCAGATPQWRNPPVVRTPMAFMENAYKTNNPKPRKPSGPYVGCHAVMRNAWWPWRTAGRRRWMSRASDSRPPP